MANILAEQQTVLFQTVKLMNQYYEYKLEDAVHKMSPFDVIFSIGNEIQQNSDNSIINNIKDNLTKLPIVMHIQLLRMFYDKSVTDILKLDFESEYSDDNSILGSKMLMQGTKMYIDTLEEIPSPFEICYLTYASWRNHPEKFNESNETSTMIETFLDDINIQTSAMQLFLKRYNKKFHNKLERMAKEANERN